MSFIKEYFNHYNENRIDIKKLIQFFRKRIKCIHKGHNFSGYCRIGNSYISRCKDCGKEIILTLKNNN